MSTFTIGQVAARTGFSRSALRYYEDVGLLSPASRSDAGYRLYDDETIGRLAFIARAKQLGCSLEEITDLADIWDGERCGPVQRRFHELVSVKLAETQRRVAELIAFASQLQSAATRLDGPPVDGPCVGDCACLADGEQQCCNFFDFVITIDDRGIALEVGAPDDATEVVTAMFGTAA